MLQQKGAIPRNLSIIVIRVNGEGRLCNSRPCINCLNYMKLFSIKTVHYSTEEGEIISEKIKEMHTTHLSVAHKKFLGILPNGPCNKQKNIKPISEIIAKIKSGT